MNVKALLDIDLVALESTEKVTMMLDMTAPITDAAKSRPGQAVEVVLDRSGSMSGAVFESAKESILKLIDRLAPQDSFGLVAFDDQALIVAPMRMMADHEMPALRKAVREMQTGGSSSAAMVQPRQESRRNRTHFRTRRRRHARRDVVSP